MKAPRWTQKIIEQIRQHARQGNAHFTLKALRELAFLELGLDETDVCEILAELRVSDFRERIVSSITRECLYVFVPKVFAVEIYVKVVVRENCVVISFHEDSKDED